MALGTLALAAGYFLGFAGVPPTILGLVFILSPTVVDQLVVGLMMFGLGNIVYFVAIWIVFSKLDHKEARAGELSSLEIESPATMRRQ